MKNIKKLIIILIIIVVIIMLIIGYMLKGLKQEEENDPILDENIGTTDVTENKSLEVVNIRDDYYTVENIINQYYSALCNLNKKAEDILIFEETEETNNFEEQLTQEKENTKKRIYNFFDKSCIEETGLTVDNIQEKLGNYNDLYVQIEEMYVKDITISLKLYFVSGTVIEKNTANGENFKLIVAIDSNNSRFNIYTFDYAKKHNFEDPNQEFDIKEIENRIYNRYKYKVLNDEEYAKKLLDSYTQSIKYNNINYSYERLNEEYKNSKFDEISEYEKYIKENRKSIITANLQSYKYNIYEDYMQYICLDQAGNYYIFNEKAVMDYDLMLDVYTIDLPETIEKYKNATNNEKVELNVQKIENALKVKDYKYLYNKLDETFRTNKFPAISDLQKYLENSIFNDYILEYMGLVQEGNIYIYSGRIKNKTNDLQQKKINIIMKLKDENDFAFSFGIE